jgi:hypothetical protein
LLGWSLAGCGGTRKRTLPRAGTAAAIATAGATRATVVIGSARTLHGLSGDEDDDDAESTSEGPPGGDSDSDYDNDYLDNLHKGYYDGDDASVRDYGHVPGATEERALASFVRRYYQAAAADDGSTACALIATNVAQAVPQEFGQGGGPSYLNGASSCQALMARLFAHSRGEFTGAIMMTGARVEGDRAYVLLGSATNPASYMTLVREGRAWKLDGLTAATLP